METLANSGLDVFAHNVETVERLQRYVRDRRANYDQSLRVLEHAKKASGHGLYTKSSIMLGLGETQDEVSATMRDLRDAGVDVLTLGQYLRPTEHHLSVERYVPPEEFAVYRRYGEDIGFEYVAAGPLVRSSYRAGELFMQAKLERRRASGGQVSGPVAGGA